MPKFNIVVRSPKGLDADSKELLVTDWPAVPLKGQGINLGPKGFTGVDVKVDDVKHWLGCDDVDVYCDIVYSKHTVRSFHSLTKEDGWKW